MLNNASMGSTGAQANALSVIEQILNEQGGEGITAALSQLYDGFSDLASASTPGAPAERQTLVGAAQTLVDVLHGADQQMRDLQLSTHGEIERVVPEINDLAARIAELNREIVRQEVVAPANDLRDQRDLLVRELATKIDINAFEDASGAQIVYLAGGMPLVEATTSHGLTLIPDPTNPFDARFSRIGHTSGTDVTATIQGRRARRAPRLAGQPDPGVHPSARHDRLQPGGHRERRAPERRRAQRRRRRLLRGAPGRRGRGAQHRARREHPRDARLDRRGTHDRARRQPQRRGARRAPRSGRPRSSCPATRRGRPPVRAARWIAQAAGTVATVGQQARGLNQTNEQQARVAETLDIRREEISGVSIDEEVTNLITLQAAFQANARVVSTVDDLLQDVLALL